MTSYFSWTDFDKSVEHITNICKEIKFSGVYGIPRGGLCLAVALSHKLNISLLSSPLKNSLIVDDVYETGVTLKDFKEIEGAMFFVLVSKKTPTWWKAVNLALEKEWIVFPWEDKRALFNEKRKYFNKRKLN